MITVPDNILFADMPSEQRAIVLWWAALSLPMQFGYAAASGEIIWRDDEYPEPKTYHDLYYRLAPGTAVPEPES